MIQRIQSIYLLLASAALGGQFALPYMKAEAVQATVFADGILNPFDNTGLIGLTLLSAIVSLVAVFLFKNRPLQGRITGGGLLSSVLLLALAVFTVYQTRQNLSQESSIQAGIALPALAAVFQWLAGRAIRKDENLVRSMDRLR